MLALYIAFILCLLVVLFLPKVMNNELWRATMTPLASIIGSGFLIAAPVLNNLGGNRAPYLMGVLCLVAFSIGSVIRWNIKNIEALEDSLDQRPFLKISEEVSDWSLAFAYVLSITYYIYLFSSFILKSIQIDNDLNKSILSTCVVVSIALFGHRKGLSSVEKIEGISVNIKLSIICTFLLALVVFNFQNTPSQEQVQSAQVYDFFSWDHIAKLMGLLIMVQGFETSRYLGDKYKAKIRTNSMIWAQGVSSFIYLTFIILFLPVFQMHPLQGEVNETSVIGVGRHVFSLGPTFLLIAAIASQLSAALADMAGSGGLVEEITRRKLKPANAYLIIASLCIVLIWCFNIFEVISYASRAFALYYSVQCLSSGIYQYKNNRLKFFASVLMGIICLAVFIFGKPFE